MGFPLWTSPGDDEACFHSAGATATAKLLMQTDERILEVRKQELISTLIPSRPGPPRAHRLCHSPTHTAPRHSEFQIPPRLLTRPACGG